MWIMREPDIRDRISAIGQGGWFNSAYSEETRFGRLRKTGGELSYCLSSGKVLQILS